MKDCVIECNGIVVAMEERGEKKIERTNVQYVIKRYIRFDCFIQYLIK